MTLLGITFDYALAMVFIAAAVGKLRHRSSFGEVAVLAASIGVPERLTRWAGPLLVAAEIAAATLLVLPPWSGWGAAVAGLLLALLTYGAWRADRRPDRPACRCFGGTAVTIGRRHVVRNAALTVAATTSVLIAVFGGASAVTAPHRAAAVVAALLLATAVVNLDTLLFLGGSGSTAATPDKGQHPWASSSPQRP